MNPKLNAIRALAAYSALQSLRLVTIIFSSIIGVLLLITFVLAYFYSPWWLLLSLPFIILAIIYGVIRLLVKKIIAKIHRHPFTTRQREQLESFTGKLKNLADIRNMSVYSYAIKTIWDVLRHRDETSIEKLVNDSKSLKSDFAELEKHFGER
ncbi:MAG TPA: hypothetical protein VL362_00530 [Patescibacteria group bacterium]|jgi:hypothetical protein|nr:hypothetical protein [Patescibacteria group bacterium]